MDKIATTKELLTQILGYFGARPQLDIQETGEGDILVTLRGDNLNYLIGYRGQSLDALENLLSHMVFKKTNEWPSLLLDINGYNEQRVERLHNLAKKFIDRVRFFQNEVEMPVLNAWERKQIHNFVAEYDDITSESRGEGRNRRMYLKTKKRKSENS